MSTSFAGTAPIVPPRPAAQSTSQSAASSSSNPFEDDAVPADPPPAYEAQPGANHEQTLAAGPSRPFMEERPQFQQHHTQSPPLATSLNAPQYPFWNGHQLTPQQTGFNPASTHYRPPPPQQSPSWAQPSHSPPFAGSQFAPPTSPPPPTTTPLRNEATTSNSTPTRKYEPTTEPTDGQPLLNQGQLLVYPKGFICSKCSNTGYKPFRNRPGDDPNHPCKQDWKKYSKPFKGALVISTNEPPDNYQRPLRLPPIPQRPTPLPYGSTAPNMMGSSPYGVQPQFHHPPPPAMYGAPSPVGHGWGNNVPAGGAIVVQAGDPRIGGRLCYKCGGDGLVMGFLFDQDTCPMCHGTGRIFM
ncbi:hypothetical protein OIO90_003028 [Microbotryomycetes sp. JL221]|nr:hypothetical protein OIO90_003028 [Microbotryomycetes sp. JL221]